MKKLTRIKIGISLLFIPQTVAIGGGVIKGTYEVATIVVLTLMWLLGIVIITY